MQLNASEHLKEIFKENGYEIFDGQEKEQLDLNSMQFIAILCDIESNFQIELSDEDLTGEKLNNFNDFVEMIINQIGDEQ